MELKLYQALELSNELESLNSEKIAFTTKFKLNKLKDGMSSIMANFNKVRNEAITEFGSLENSNDEGAEPSMVILESSENYPLFISQMDDILRNTVVELPDIDLRISEFENVNSDVNYKQIMHIIKD